MESPIKLVVSLGGGGFRGLFTIEFLALLEAEVGSLSERASLFAGTSVGSINALALASGLSAAKIRDAMVMLGKTVFPPERIPYALLVSQTLSSRRDPSPLRASLVDMLGESTLGNTRVPAIAAAVDITGGKQRVFKPSKLGGSDDAYRLVDICMASAAAPTYFPPHTIDSKAYADGGLFANAPDLIAAVEATTSTNWAVENMRLLCIGATLSNNALASSDKTADLTGIHWIKDGILMAQLMGAQVRFSRDCARRIIGSSRYFAVDPPPSADQERVLGLDVATDDAARTLRSMAEDAFEAFRLEQKLFISLLKHSIRNT